MPSSPAAPIAAAAAAAPFLVTHMRPSSARASLAPRKRSQRAAAAAEGPSCLFVGPIDRASKETLEALYQQARYSYYNGEPLIVDDMFDKVELKLRLYGSKSVVKYPRCSLRRHSTYADAEEDRSQVIALASVWILLFVFGSSAVLVPVIYAIGQALDDAMHPRYFSRGDQSPSDAPVMLNVVALFIGLGYLVGYPVASASVEALTGLWRNDLVALKGSCPNCGEEVFAFVKAEKSNLHPHDTECHVCESSLVFRPKVERNLERLLEKIGDRPLLCHISKICKSISFAVARTEQFDKKVQDQRARKDEYAALTSQQLPLLGTIEEKSSEDLTETKNMEEAIVWYKMALGFRNEVGEGFKFIFNNIDLKNVDREYIFTVGLDVDIYKYEL